MKFQSLFFASFLVAGAVASPTPGEQQCQKYTYNPPQCPHCPYQSMQPRDTSDIADRELSELFERGGYPNCQKQCPDNKKQCKKYSWDQNVQYSAYHEQTVYCGKGYSYEVIIKLEPCGKDYCLNVYYQDKYNNKQYYCGVYQGQQSNENPDSLDDNGYCHGNKCSVPVEHLPGYPNICGKTYWVGIDSSRCYNGGGKMGQHWLKYVPVKIECQRHKKCTEYCCCP
ncbi:hypothetical protein G7046_g9488 [Stylonectria norvegica]|nr:hypothetical protein G7046_g9488 [Stylonectria norvegica]